MSRSWAAIGFLSSDVTLVRVPTNEYQVPHGRVGMTAVAGMSKRYLRTLCRSRHKVAKRSRFRCSSNVRTRCTYSTTGVEICPESGSRGARNRCGVQPADKIEVEQVLE